MTLVGFPETVLGKTINELLDGSSAIRKLSQKNSLLNPRSLPTSLTARIPAEMCHQLLASPRPCGSPALRIRILPPVYQASVYHNL